MPSVVIVILLFFTTVLWTVEARVRADDTGTSESRSSCPRTYQAAVDRAPEVLRGCAEVLKNFA